MFCFLQNVFNMVVEVPRWTNAKMEVTVLRVWAEVLELSRLLTLPALPVGSRLCSLWVRASFVEKATGFLESQIYVTSLSDCNKGSLKPN